MAPQDGENLRSRLMKAWIIERVWDKAQVISPEMEKRHIRVDTTGNWIRKEDYQNLKSLYGWDIEQIQAIEDGGSRSVGNLRPSHLKNRRHAWQDLFFRF